MPDIQGGGAAFEDPEPGGAQQGGVKETPPQRHHAGHQRPQRCCVRFGVPAAHLIGQGDEDSFKPEERSGHHVERVTEAALEGSLVTHHFLGQAERIWLWRRLWCLLTRRRRAHIGITLPIECIGNMERAERACSASASPSGVRIRNTS